MTGNVFLDIFAINVVKWVLFALMAFWAISIAFGVFKATKVTGAPATVDILWARKWTLFLFALVLFALILLVSRETAYRPKNSIATPTSVEMQEKLRKIDEAPPVVIESKPAVDPDAAHKKNAAENEAARKAFEQLPDAKPATQP